MEDCLIGRICLLGLWGRHKSERIEGSSCLRGITEELAVLLEEIVAVAITQTIVDLVKGINGAYSVVSSVAM
jgi:hypothetical protein